MSKMSLYAIKTCLPIQVLESQSERITSLSSWDLLGNGGPENRKSCVSKFSAQRVGHSTGTELALPTRVGRHPPHSILQKLLGLAPRFEDFQILQYRSLWFSISSAPCPLMTQGTEQTLTSMLDTRRPS